MTSLAHHWEQQGIEKGIQQGMQIGRNEGKYEVAKNMLAAGSNPDFISKVTGLPIDKITKLL